MSPRSVPAGRRAWKYALSVAGVLVAATVTTIGSGLGDRILDSFDEETPPVSPVSHSEEELVGECATPLFVSDPRAKQLVSGAAPSPIDWNEFRRANDASVISPDVVQVSIQGESDRTITLTRIDFTVDRQPRPAGATFANPCGGPGEGRFIQVDLDRNPVAISHSGEDPKGTLGVFPGQLAQRPPKPIQFPWTVSVQDSLTLSILAQTKRCFCTWRAGIHWRSGAQSGVLKIDNQGKGYTAVGDIGAVHFVRGGSPGPAWNRFTPRN